MTREGKTLASQLFEWAGGIHIGTTALALLVPVRQAWTWWWTGVWPDMSLGRVLHLPPEVAAAPWAATHVSFWIFGAGLAVGGVLAWLARRSEQDEKKP